jgi:hypothetical protein
MLNKISTLFQDEEEYNKKEWKKQH